MNNICDKSCYRSRQLSAAENYEAFSGENNPDAKRWLAGSLVFAIAGAKK